MQTVMFDANGDLDGINAGQSDPWVAKYDSQGNLLWIEQFGTSSEDYSTDVAVDSNDNVYITGPTEGSLEGVNAGIDDEWRSDDAWVAKISQSNPPIYRFYNSAVPGTYLFVGPDESQSIRENYSNFIEEGMGFS